MHQLLTDLHELARYPDPLSPEAAARSAGRPPPDLRAAASYIAALAEDRDLVIVEDAGGLLVRYDPAGLDDRGPGRHAGRAGADRGRGRPRRAGSPALTLEALAARELRCAGVVIGSWPAGPGLAERSNLSDLAALAGQPLAGRLPEGIRAAGWPRLPRPRPAQPGPRARRRQCRITASRNPARSPGAPGSQPARPGGRALSRARR